MEAPQQSNLRVTSTLKIPDIFAQSERGDTDVVYQSLRRMACTSEMSFVSPARHLGSHGSLANTSIRIPRPFRGRDDQWRADEDDRRDQEDAQPILEREL